MMRHGLLALRRAVFFPLRPELCHPPSLPSRPGAQVHALVQEAVAQGAKLLAGGEAPDAASGGQFYRPTVLADVTPEMRISKEEVFGPVLSVTPFDSDDDAVALANGCDFGLGSNVFSRDVRRARAIGARLEAGMTAINDFAATYMSQASVPTVPRSHAAPPPSPPQGFLAPSARRGAESAPPPRAPARPPGAALRGREGLGLRPLCW